MSFNLEQHGEGLWIAEGVRGRGVGAEGTITIVKLSTVYMGSFTKSYTSVPLVIAEGTTLDEVTAKLKEKLTPREFPDVPFFWRGHTFVPHFGGLECQEPEFDISIYHGISGLVFEINLGENGLSHTVRMPEVPLEEGLDKLLEETKAFVEEDLRYAATRMARAQEAERALRSI